VNRSNVLAFVFSATTAAATACAASSSLLGPDAPQGIEGQVTLGPMCPVVQAGNPCPDQPYQAWIDIHDAGGKYVTRIQSDTDGRFRVGLEPGSYELHPESGNPLPRASDQQVEVAAGAYTAVTIAFDTGIR
jgi:hypothetical protein